MGRSAITEVAQVFMTAFPDLRVLMDDLVVQGDGAVYHWTLIGANTGLGGTGQRVRISGFEVWRIGVDGLIAESRATSTVPPTNVSLNAASRDPSSCRLFHLRWNHFNEWRSEHANDGQG
jgi:hypothetical protein